MNSTTHKGNHFTAFHKNKIRSAIHDHEPNKQKRPSSTIILMMTATALALFFLLSTNFTFGPSNNGTHNDGTSAADVWETRDQFTKDGKVLFIVYPDPSLTAGKPFGYLFSFDEHFLKFKDKELAIYAVNTKTNERVIAMGPKKITEPSPGYPSLQRFTTTFAIPYGGLWKYEVYVDEEFYGDVVLSVKENTQKK